MQTGSFTNQPWRKRSKALWALLLRCTGVLPLARWWVGRSGVVVLTFHRVLTENELRGTMSLPGMIVRAETFDQFLQYASKRWKMVDLGKPPDWTGDSRLKIAITFDDGWCDNVTSAYPIARKHDVPITIFIVPEKMGSTLPFWPEKTALGLAGFPRGASAVIKDDYVNDVIEHLKELPSEERSQRIERMKPDGDMLSASTKVDRTMSWEQTEQLQEGGVTFGSHTNSHEILTRIPVSEAEHEITSSRALIRERLRSGCELFAYPNGDCSPEVRDLVEKAGYSFAFVNDQPGVWARDCDPYVLPRTNICEHHLMDSRGGFSPLIFEYTVLLRVAEGMLAGKCSAWFSKITGNGRKSEGNHSDARKAPAARQI
jgi:peptidoglycan/xylan/chitin deacetylase (PgdA/CDA1 family)